MNRRTFISAVVAAPASRQHDPCAVNSRGHIVRIGSAEPDSEEELMELNAIAMKSGHRWCCTNMGDNPAEETDTRFGWPAGTTQLMLDSYRLLRFNGQVFYLRRLSKRELAMYAPPAKQEP